MTKQELTDALAWMQEIQARIAFNGIIDTLYASNVIGKTAMSAIGLFGPLNHFLYAASIMFVSGSQMLYGRYLAKDREKIHGLFTVNVLSSIHKWIGCCTPKLRPTMP